MELLMKNIHMCRQAKQASLQITLDEDINVPDASPDVELIIQSREHIVLEHTRVENGRLYLDGSLEVSILYMDDTPEHQLRRLDTRLGFDETMNAEEMENRDNITIHTETEDLSVALINSRKLAVRALLGFSAAVNEIYDMSAAVETRTPVTMCERRKKLDLMQMEVQKKDIFRLKEDLPVPPGKPDVSEILWENTQMRGCRIQPGEGELRVEGTLLLFVLYRGEDESRSVQWIEQKVPFEGTIACSGSRAELVPDIRVTPGKMEITAREDAEGELRLLHLEGVLDLEIQMYGSEEAEVLEDVYSPEKKLNVTSSGQMYERLVMRNESKCKAGEKIRIQGAKPRILQICHATGSVKIDSARIVEDGIRIEGAVPVSILYISSDDAMPFAVLEGNVPFVHTAQVPGITGDCRFVLTSGLEQLSCAMADSEEIEAKAVILLNLFVVKPEKQVCIQSIDESDYTVEELEKVPGITGYIVQGGETLWEIGKEYFLTPQQIMEDNGLESEELKPGEVLILMKCCAERG